MPARRCRTGARLRNHCSFSFQPGRWGGPVLSTGAPGMTFEEAQTCVIEFYAEAGESLTPYALIEKFPYYRSKLYAEQEYGIQMAVGLRGSF